ncbi:MAG: hypothetical protein ACRDPR_06255 [Nocardioidaceae bacterium]
MSTSRWKKRASTGVALGAAGLVLFAAVAFACTQRVGTFTVCEPPSTVYNSASCAKITGTTQSGKVGGVNGVSSGNTFSGRASSFKSKLYQVTFRNAGTTADCHRVNANTTILADVATGATKFAGPSWYKTFVVPTQTATGSARICTQDVPDVVTGQIIDVTVL